MAPIVMLVLQVVSLSGGKYENLPRAYNSRHFPREANSGVGPEVRASLMQSNN